MRKLHNEQLYDLHCSPNIIRVIKLRTVRWIGYMACIEEKGDTDRVLVGKHEAQS
jgi:hypothetical protein